MRADETGAGSNRRGFMPPITSRPADSDQRSFAAGDRIAPPSVWRPAAVSGAFEEPKPLTEELAVVEVASEPGDVVAPTAEVVETPATETSEEPWAEAAATETALPPEEEPWAVAAVTETETPADIEPWAEAAATEPEATPESEPWSDAAVTDSQAPEVAEPTPLVEEFALESFLLPEVEEPVAEQEVTETALVADFEEPAALPESGELAYAEPPAVEAETPEAQPAASRTLDLGERLEKVAQELRGGSADDVIRKLASGDRLDALLAGLLAGFLARPSE